MKHLLSTITVLFVLLTSTVSWGGVDGKGIICKSTNISDNLLNYPSFYIFEDGTVQINEIEIESDVFIITKGEKLTYKTSSSKISWYSLLYDRRYTLNRKDLSLKIHSHLIEFSVCEVYPTKILMEKINEMLIDHQSEYDKKRKGNKI